MGILSFPDCNPARLSFSIVSPRSLSSPVRIVGKREFMTAINGPIVGGRFPKW